MDEIREATRTGDVNWLNKKLAANRDFPLATPKFTSFLRTPLHEASIRGHVEFARVIVNRNPVLAMEVDSQGFTPLHLASTTDNIKMVRLLRDANPNACVVPDQNGRTPLHLAAMRDEVEVMELLIQSRPRAIHQKLVNSNETILHLCVKHKAFHAMKMLVDYLGNPANIADIPDPISVNSVDSGRNTILHLAAQLKQMKMLRYLITSDDIGININIRNNEEVTALQMLDRYEMQSLGIGCYDTSEGPERSTTSNNEWLRERLNTIMIVATLIGGIAFQAVINPPGGVFQDDSKIDLIEDPVKFTYYFRNFISYPGRPRGFQSLESYIQNQLGNITADEIIDSRVAFVQKLYSAAKSNDSHSHTSPVSPYMTRKLGTGIVLEDWWMNMTSNYNNTMGGRSGFSPYLLRYAGTAIMAYAFPNAYASYIILNSSSLVVCGLTILIVTFDVIIQRPSESTGRKVRYLEVLVTTAVACISLSYMIVIRTIAPPFWDYGHVYSQLGEMLIAVACLLIPPFAFLLVLSWSREQALGHPFFKRFIWRRNSRIYLFIWLIVKIVLFLLVLLVLWNFFIRPLG